MFRKTSSFLAILTIYSGICMSSYASAESNNGLEGTWSRGEVTQDPIPPFSGYITDSTGKITKLDSSPFTENNIIENGQVPNSSSGGSEFTTFNWWNNNNTLYYEYIPGSYTQTSSSSSMYHYNVGVVSAYNGTTHLEPLTYKQSGTATSTWQVSAQISTTAEIKTNFFQKLSATLGATYTNTVTTSSSNEALTSIDVTPGKTGYIYAFLDGGYSYGTAKYKEYMLNPVAGLIATGNTVTTNEGGWAPLNNSSVFTLHFSSAEL
mgnify:CR=1 FL=1|jgi:hypothetical protein